MAPKIGQQMPRAPMWPWGGPRSVREKLVDKTQLDRKARKKGDPKNPSLASVALLDFIGPASSAEELRLPMPPMPGGHDADVEGYSERPALESVADRGGEGQQELMEQSLSMLKAAPERVDRLKSLLQREAQMLQLVGQVKEDVAEIERRRRAETVEEGY